MIISFYSRKKLFSFLPYQEKGDGKKNSTNEPTLITGNTFG
jgi:hypothetical protein